VYITKGEVDIVSVQESLVCVCVCTKIEIELKEETNIQENLNLAFEKEHKIQ
jgi:hypothetical protein